MSREFRHAKRPARVRPVSQLEAPAAEVPSATPHMAPVEGIARALPHSADRMAADPLGGTAAGPDVVSALRRRRGGGSPLPDDVARSFGDQLGTDLSGVRVHTDTEADRISRSVGAHAFTHGTDVYFTSGAYDTSGSGQRVLAHELAHVAQNAAGKFRADGASEIGRADDPAEKDADHTAGELLSALRRTPVSQTFEDGAEVDGSTEFAIRRLSVAQLKKLHEDAIAAIAASAARDKRRGGGPAPAPAHQGGAAEAGAGGSHYEPYTPEPDAEPAGAVGSHYEPYTPEPDAEPAAAPGGGGRGGEPRPEDLQLSKRIDDAEKSDQEEAAAAAGPAAAAKPARTRGDSSPHKAWLLARIDPTFADERGKSKQDLMNAVTPHLKRIAAYWEALDVIHKVGSHDDPGYPAKSAEALKQVRAALAAVPMGKAFSERAKNLSLDDLTLSLEAEHARCVEWLRREDLPIQNDGTLNYPKTAGGQYDTSSRVVKYNEGEEREATKVAFSGGILKRSGSWKPEPGPDGQDPSQGGAVPVDTDRSVTHFTGPGWEIFVAGEDGQIYMTSHKIGVQHHSSLLAGADVAIGGEMKVAGGRIVEMSNKSGHYLPTVDSLVQFLHWLDKDGIGLNFKVSGFGVPPGTTGENLLKGADAQGNVDPKKAYEMLKTNAVMRALIEEYTQQRVEQVIAEEGLTVADGKITNRQNKEVSPKEFRQILQKKLGKAKRTVSQGKFANGKPTHTQTWKA